MADAPSPSWKLLCPWCSFYIWVNNRGRRGNDPGAGVEVAGLMKQHIEEHGRTWEEFLAEKDPAGSVSILGGPA